MYSSYNSDIYNYYRDKYSNSDRPSYNTSDMFNDNLDLPENYNIEANIFFDPRVPSSLKHPILGYNFSRDFRSPKNYNTVRNHQNNTFNIQNIINLNYNFNNNFQNFNNLSNYNLLSNHYNTSNVNYPVTYTTNKYLSQSENYYQTIGRRM